MDLYDYPLSHCLLFFELMLFSFHQPNVRPRGCLTPSQGAWGLSPSHIYDSYYYDVPAAQWANLALAPKPRRKGV